MEDFIERLPNWARWIIALPAALLCSWIGRAVAVFCYQWWNGGASFWSDLTGTAIEALVFVYVLYEIVPKYKFICSVVVNSLICVLMLFLTIYAVLNGTGDESLIGTIINNLIMIGILICSCVMIYNEEHKHDYLQTTNIEEDL